MNDEDYEEDLKACPDYPYFLGDWDPDGADEMDHGIDPDAPMD